MADPWAFGWEAIGALATAAAVIVAAWAWRVDVSRARRDRAALVTISTFTDIEFGTEEIIETRNLEGRVLYYGRDGEPLQRQSDAVLTRDDGVRVCMFGRQVTEIRNASPATAFEILGLPLSRDGEEVMESIGGHPVFASAMAPGATYRFTEDEYSWIGGTGLRLTFRVEGADWLVTSEGDFRRVRSAALRNSLRRRRRRRRHPSLEVSRLRDPAGP